MAAKNVKTARAQLKLLLPSYVPGLLAENIYSYKPRIFGAKTPAAVISGVRRRRNRARMVAEGHRLILVVTLTLFVLYTDATASWDEGDAADHIDDLEAGVANLLDAEQRTSAWYRIDYGGDSTEGNEEIDGGFYGYIDIPLEIGIL